MTTYLNTFTGSTIAPANASYNLISFVSAQSIQLVWNLNGYDTSVNSAYFAATYVAVNTSVGVASPILFLPPANQVSPGEEITLINTGVHALSVKANGQVGQANVVVLPPQEAVKLIVAMNNTAAGQWLVVETSAAGGLATIAGLSGRGITTRVNDMGTTVFDSVWPQSLIGGGTVTLYPSQAAQVLTFDTAADITLSNTVSGTDMTEAQIGAYFIIKNTSTARLVVNASVMDGETGGYVYINPGAFTIFTYAGQSSWFSLSGIASIGSGNNSSTNLGLNATTVDCQNGPGAVGNIYTMTNQDFGSVIKYINVQTNQQVILPARVAIYVIYNSSTPESSNIVFKSAGTIAGNTVTVTGTQFSVIATDGAGNAYPGISSLPGGQFVNARPGSQTLPGIFFDNDESTGWHSGPNMNNPDGLIGTNGNVALTISGLDAETFTAAVGAATVTHFRGSAARPFVSTMYGNETIVGGQTVLDGIDGGVI